MAWPVDTPDKPAVMHTTLTGGGGTSVRFDGPANVLAALIAVQRAALEVTKTKEAYDALPQPPDILR